jgi:type II restriction/modification system DNA methylase subunit YeeA
MPVNTAALKTFAPAMRRQLLEAVGRKLDLLFNSQTPDTLSTYAKQIAALREQEEENREQLLERVAYTWFNRLCALRYLDARGWHPFGGKVLMPAAEGETQPELLKVMRAGSLPSELKQHTNEARLHGLLDGQIPPAIAGSDPQGEVYRELVLASSRSYHQLLPTLFEGLDDASELLLPDDLLSDGSVAGGFRSQISDSDCDDVEIIGWLYQFYISEKKDQVIGKVVKSEDIPAATQLFTPNWIVKYMVQNSLGAQWLATYPASALKGQMEYCIEPAEQTDEVKEQLAAITPDALNPEELTLIDPACGSGHILVEAYELFKAIYLERGYPEREIPQLTLEKNLYGLDIDERAAQLTSFALMMKGRGDDRRLFERGIQLNVMALVNSDELDMETLANAINLADHGLKQADLVELKKLFEHAITFGSLIQVPDGLAEKLPAMRRLSELKGQDMLVAEALKTLGPLVRQAEMLGARYDAVVANPPYMGMKAMNAQLKGLASSEYSDFKIDTYSMFVGRALGLANATGSASLVTMHSWMFLHRFENMRRHLLTETTIRCLGHLGPRAFSAISGEVVQTCCFVLGRRHVDGYIPVFSRCVDGNEEHKREVLKSHTSRYTRFTSEDFLSISGSILAYWISHDVMRHFHSEGKVASHASPRHGMVTSDNDRFLRFHWEVSLARQAHGCLSREAARETLKKWFPYNKGGPPRRWYGNAEFLLNWEDDGREVIGYARELYGSPTRKIQSQEFYFHDGLTWSALGSGDISLRANGPGYLFDSKGSSMFFASDDVKHLMCGLFNSKVAALFISVMSPTLDFSAGSMASMPLADQIEIELGKNASDCSKRAIRITKTDWDSYEHSWDFQSLPLLSVRTNTTLTLESSYTAWTANNKQTIAEMKRLEEENNRLFIDAYGLQDDLTPEVQIEQITLTVNPAYRYGGDLTEDELWFRFRRDTMAEFLSYATGCMMGRYSLDQSGMILADSCDNQAAQLDAYEQKVGKPLTEVKFKPDPDAILPVLDGEWFEDDIIARTREFLEVTFPESTVTENLRFIEESLGKDIRKYFCSEFYKDHMQTYKKRPIYWMVQSPKKGFACLIYLHRYTKDTLNQVLNNYFRPYLQKLEARLAQLGLDQLNDDLPTRERSAARKEAEKITKVLKECQAWEQDALLPLAQQRIELDLDDGVKVNYLKLQDVLAPIPGLAAKED